ncbi:hypothetical protein AVEN_136167-1 [Araneus ventricosus]|uniref:Uncharacterized protein n=1 Tax=Araneus ventricosus TaxID=182803 RepID=A0A4Y2IHD8_ARAVE|nr:hypothetical protein AVEN_136167-1 [Araneus ventricosus]
MYVAVQEWGYFLRKALRRIKHIPRSRKLVGTPIDDCYYHDGLFVRFVPYLSKWYSCCRGIRGMGRRTPIGDCHYHDGLSVKFVPCPSNWYSCYHGIRGMGRRTPIGDYITMMACLLDFTHVHSTGSVAVMASGAWGVVVSARSTKASSYSFDAV